MSPREDNYWLNRTLCDVLLEMRTCCETRNFSYLPALIEEAQCMGNRMEAGLANQRDLAAMQEEWHRLKQEIEDMRKLKVTL